MYIRTLPLSRVAHIQTLSMAALVQNRPSSKSITVQTTVGRLTARGLSHGTAGEGGEVPIILFSKHGEKGSVKLYTCA